MYYLIKWDREGCIFIIYQENKRENRGTVVKTYNYNGTCFREGEIWFGINNQPNETILFKHKDLNKVKEAMMLEML